jgi:DNA-directed RNA polymerase subunit beta'
MAGYDENDYYGFGGGGALGPAVPLDEFGYDDYR